MTRADTRAADAADLQKLGYAQQLLRDMGGFSNFALSFSIISILTGAITLYGHGIKHGGPLVMSAGWVLVTLMTLPVAASLAQLASSYPTAGALYHWSAILGGRRYGRGLGFLTAWLNTIGQFAITAGIDYGLAELACNLLGWTSQTGTPAPGDRAIILRLYAAILVSHAILNHIGIRAVTLLNWLSAWYHIAIVAVLIGALLMLAPMKPVSFLATRFTSEKFPYWYGFLIGLLQAQWTFTGYDASAHVTEETRDPRRNAPWGVFLSVLVSGVVGYAMLICLTLAIRDLPATAGAAQPFIHLVTTAIGQKLGVLVCWLVLGAMWFCGLASVTSNSRMLFAFARDGGLPFSRLVARVSPRWQSPFVAVWISAAAALVVALWADAYSAITALSTLALYASYGVPILVGFLARRRGHWAERGPWDLGRFSSLVNLIAIAWIAIITVLFVLPPNLAVGYTFAGCLVLIALYWLVWMRKPAHFRGPPVMEE